VAKHLVFNFKNCQQALTLPKKEITMQDALWKGIIEDLFSDFLLYFYPEWSIQNVDFERDFEFLDKELETIYPERKGKRYADKLVKVPLLSGKEQWFLIHIEVQGYEDITFPERMFQYFYRIRDKHQKDVLAMVILTDENKDFHPKKYEYSFQKTKIEYHFDTFKILEKTENELNIPNNIFSIVMLVAKKALKKRQKDEKIIQWKIELVKELLKGGYEQKKIRQVMNFIQFFVNFASEEVVKEYEEELSKIIKTRTNMGIEQTIIEHFKEEGRQEGRQEGMEKGKYAQALKTAEKCLLRGMSIKDTVELTELPLKTVQELANKLDK
jgi:predicted transposase/invertase (TIGR01784 family)